MLMKLVVVLFLIIILYALGSALFFLVRDNKTDETRVVKALSWRIGLSLFLFVLLLVAFSLGWITPHAV
jgi:putative copper export protein